MIFVVRWGWFTVTDIRGHRKKLPEDQGATSGASGTLLKMNGCGGASVFESAGSEVFAEEHEELD
ncbi:hypothetical protein, partial [Acidithiobacillus ferrooxidans]